MRRDDTISCAMKPIFAIGAKIRKPPQRILLATARPMALPGAHMEDTMTFARSNFRGGRLVVATTLALGLLTTLCHAYSAEQQQLCTGDAMRLCSSEIPDVDRITACMARQRASLSEGCRAVFAPAAPVAYQPVTSRASKPINPAPSRVK